MELGAFSISLNVKDIEASLDSYAKLGFAPLGEAEEQGEGPVGFVVVDPDGNPILVDQHA